MTGTFDEIFILSLLLTWTAEILNAGMFSNRLLFPGTLLSSQSLRKRGL